MAMVNVVTIAAYASVDVVDNLLYNVNIVCLLIYFLNVLLKLFVSSKNAHFYLMCRQPNLHELARKFGARNLCKKLVQETCARFLCKFLTQVSCASFLPVCHHRNNITRT